MTKQKQHSAHSIFSASAANRWTQCPGSIPLVEATGAQDRYSFAAAEGTALHELMERCLLSNKDALDFDKLYIPQEGGTTAEADITDEQYSVVQDVVDRVREIEGSLLVEQKVNYADILGVEYEEGFGTCDIMVIKGNTLHIADAKFGRRAVKTTGNLQMILYALGGLSICDLMGDDIQHVHIEVLQPRVTMKTPVWELEVEDLRAWGDELREDAQDVQRAREAMVKEKGPKVSPEWAVQFLNPGEDQCQFCRAAAFCRALQVEAEIPINMFEDDPADIETLAKATKADVTPRVEAANADDLGLAMSKVGLLKIYINAIEAETKFRLSTGVDVTGFKLVRGRAGNRYWIDPSKALETLREAEGVEEEVYMTTPTLRTPSQVATAVKKIAKHLDTDVKELLDSVLTVEVSRTEPKPSLAPDDDPRPRWSGVDIDTEFEDLA